MESKNELPCWAVLGVIGSLILIVVFAMNYPGNSTEWAAWVQAFGSIGAIVAAIFIMSFQVKNQRNLIANEKKKALRSAIMLLNHGGNWINAYINDFLLKESETISGSADPMQVWSEIFQNMDVTEPALIEIAVPVTNIRLNVAVIVTVLTSIDNKEKDISLIGQKKTLKVCCDSIKRNTDVCLKHL